MILQDPFPHSFYYLIGVIVVVFAGLIGSVLLWLLRGAWFFSKIDSRINEARDMAVRAHKRISELEGEK